ncbi:hypothetical protein ANCCAN_19179 [Ancylostoma caninum]|uniref:Uncharacterized protein n=1 Tax=Ancylostoma caninum TaxID=29170 RepID=A0A368FS43_ANCCA|nr:hypothetical protein ANCCAN_19179 [Ancylostoma caninum]
MPAIQLFCKAEIGPLTCRQNQPLTNPRPPQNPPTLSINTTGQEQHGGTKRAHGRYRTPRWTRIPPICLHSWAFCHRCLLRHRH